MQETADAFDAFRASLVAKRNKRAKRAKRTHNDTNDTTIKRLRFKEKLKGELKEELKEELAKKLRDELTEEVVVLVKMELYEDARATTVDTPIITDKVLELEGERDDLAKELAKAQEVHININRLWQEDIDTNLELRCEKAGLEKERDELAASLEKTNAEFMETRQKLKDARHGKQKCEENYNSVWLELQKARRVIADAKEARAQRKAERKATQEAAEALAKEEVAYILHLHNNQ